MADKTDTAARAKTSDLDKFKVDPHEDGQRVIDTVDDKLQELIGKHNGLVEHLKGK